MKNEDPSCRTHEKSDGKLVYKDGFQIQLCRLPGVQQTDLLAHLHHLYIYSRAQHDKIFALVFIVLVNGYL